jgi:iron complex outermembrane receptor protein
MALLTSSRALSALVLLPWMATPAFAQTGPAADTGAAPAEAAAPDGEFEDIVITARQRRELTQDVPISITALSGAQLEQRGISNATELRTQVPSLSSEATGGPNSAFPNFGIRGQRSDSYFVLQSPAVITYFAGAPQGHPVGFGESLYDIGSITVLKGPQGTLFGMNGTGGAILVEPHRPTQDFEGSLRLRYGNYDTREIGGMLNVPLDEAVSLRVAGQLIRNDGYMRNLTTGAGQARAHTNAFRASLLIQPPGSALTSLTVFDYFRDTGAPAGNFLVYVNPIASPAPGGSLLGQRPALLADVLAAYQRYQQRRGSDRWNIESGAGTGTVNDALGRDLSQDIENYGITNNTEIAITDNLTLRNIFSLRRIDANVDTNFAPTPNGIINFANYRQRLDQVSEEVQLIGKAFDNRLDWVIGGFYRHEEGYDDARSVLVNGVRQRASGGGVLENYSVFAQGSFKITPQLSITLGGRYNHDVIYGYSDSVTLAGTSPLVPQSAVVPTQCSVGTLVNGVLQRFPLSACLLDGRATFNKPTFTASLEYQPEDGFLPGARNTLLYATARRGYRAGGFNVRASSYPAFGPYLPETIMDYEVGFKSDWDIGGTFLRTNVAVFYDQLSNLQRSVSIPVPGITIPQATTTNAAESTVYGVELEIAFRPFRGMEISGFYNYLKNRYDSYISTNQQGQPVDLSGRPFRATAENKFAINASYAANLGDAGELVLAGNYTWQDEITFLEVPDVTGSFNPQRPYGLINARLDWNNIFGTNIDIGLYGRNLANKFYVIGLSDLSSSQGVVSATPGEPRTYGVELRFRF